MYTVEMLVENLFMQGLLKLLEGSEVEVPVGASSKNAMVPLDYSEYQKFIIYLWWCFPGFGRCYQRAFE
jgi:hypothetical protein